jgi:single-strand DNA-binding protein
MGRLGRDPEMRYTQKGKPVCNMSVAVDSGWGDNQKTIWFRVTAWGNLAERCNEWLAKGDRIMFDARIEPDENGNPKTWTSNKTGEVKASYEVTANFVKFIDMNGPAASDGYSGGDQQEDDYEPIPL